MNVVQREKHNQELLQVKLKLAVSKNMHPFVYMLCFFSFQYKPAPPSYICVLLLAIMSTISTTSNFSQHLSCTYVISSAVFPAQKQNGSNIS